jgi:hypothetical protein
MAVNSYYTAIQYQVLFCKASYWHRLIDVEKLVKVGFYQTDRLKEKYFEVRGNSQFRKMTPKDVPKVTRDIEKTTLKNLKLYQSSTKLGLNIGFYQGMV